MGSFRRYILSHDVFGHDVTLNYKGNNEFPTVLGAFFSILVKLLTVSFLTKKTFDLVQMNDPTTNIF